MPPARITGDEGALAVSALGALTTLYVGQTETELTVKDDATYRLDGRESVNKPQNFEKKTKASWEGGKLVLSSTYAGATANGKFGIQLKETWSVAGSVLTIERTATTSSHESRTRKLVYNLHN